MYLEENFWSGPGDPRQQNRQADRARMTQIANFHDSSLNEVTYGRLTSAFQRRRKSRTRSVPLTVPCLCQGSLRPTPQSRPGTVRPRLYAMVRPRCRSPYPTSATPSMSIVQMLILPRGIENLTNTRRAG